MIFCRGGMRHQSQLQVLSAQCKVQTTIKCDIRSPCTQGLVISEQRQLSYVKGS